MTARALGIPAGGAILVRPDGVPAAWWTADAGSGAVLDATVAGAPAPRAA